MGFSTHEYPTITKQRIDYIIHKKHNTTERAIKTLLLLDNNNLNHHWYIFLGMLLIFYSHEVHNCNSNMMELNSLL